MFMACQLRGLHFETYNPASDVLYIILLRCDRHSLLVVIGHYIITREDKLMTAKSQGYNIMLALNLVIVWVW